MKIWLDANNSPPDENYVPVESVAEAGLWVVLGEAFRDTAMVYDDLDGMVKWKATEISVPNDEMIISDMRAWLKETNRKCRVCVH